MMKGQPSGIPARPKTFQWPLLIRSAVQPLSNLPNRVHVVLLVAHIAHRLAWRCGRLGPQNTRVVGQQKSGVEVFALQALTP